MGTKNNNMKNIKEVDGDLLQLASKGNFDVIAHGCNCFNAMGAGIARSIKEKYPEACSVDQRTARRSRKKLGTMTLAKCDSVWVANLYTQYYIGTPPDGKPPLCYKALRKSLKELLKFCEEHKLSRVGLPYIGAGLAGGDWKVIKETIEKVFIDSDIEVTIVNYNIKTGPFKLVKPADVKPYTPPTKEQLKAFNERINQTDINAEYIIKPCTTKGEE
jgi:O-acetyl-ADP-ribose deacetylase (regulator of RNase III)